MESKYDSTRGLCESGALAADDETLLAMANLVNADCYGEALGAACQDEDSGRMTCVGSILRLDQGRVAVTINIRYPISCDGEEIVKNVEKACKRLHCQLKLKKLDPAHRFPLEHPVVKLLTDTYNQVMGDDRKPFVLPGGTYSRKLPNSISYPTMCDIENGGKAWTFGLFCRFFASAPCPALVCLL